MFRKLGIILFVLSSLFGSVAFGAQLENDWSEFIHYAKIGRIELAESYGQKIINSDPDPKELLAISKENPAGYNLLLNMYAHSEQLKEVSGEILDIIEQGRYERRTDAAIIAEEIRRLSSTSRGRLKAIERLKNSGEYAVVLMIDALSDPSRRDEFANVTSALPKIGRDAIRPLAGALQTQNVAVKAEIINALGEIGYAHALPYLKYVVEGDNSPQMKQLAVNAINKIDPRAMNLSAAELFFSLANDYYYQKESLSVRAGYDFGNVWFWDKDQGRLIREEVALDNFYYAMSMRCCEWALRADPNIGKAIGLWVAAFFQIEENDLGVPDYFGPNHADAMTYAKTAGPEFLHITLQRALNDGDDYVALQAVEALAVSAGEKSLLYMVGTKQPLIEALSYDDKAVRYSAAIAIGQAGPTIRFPESELIIENLAQALSAAETEDFDQQLAQEYSMRAINVMHKLAVQENEIVNVIKAKPAILEALKDSREEMKVMAQKVLARLQSPDAQRAIADAALNEDNSLTVRLQAFSALSTSAKLFGNLLEDQQVDRIYQIINNEQIDQSIRSGAAGAYGALSLPSDKVKDLILDQAVI